MPPSWQLLDGLNALKKTTNAQKKTFDAQNHTLETEMLALNRHVKAITLQLADLIIEMWKKKVNILENPFLEERATKTRAIHMKRCPDKDSVLRVSCFPERWPH